MFEIEKNGLDFKQQLNVINQSHQKYTIENLMLYHHVLNVDFDFVLIIVQRILNEHSFCNKMQLVQNNSRTVFIYDKIQRDSLIGDDRLSLKRGSIFSFV